MSTISRTALPRQSLPVWFNVIASVGLTAGKRRDQEKRTRVLVIDDESAVREVLSLYLGDSGMEVATARSGDGARALVGRGRFDVVILDWRLERDEGPELLHLFKTQHPELPVILFTGTDIEGSHIEAARARKADAIIRKGRPLEDLRTAILQSLARRQAQSLSAA